jgi:hypothetical protein
VLVVTGCSPPAASRVEPLASSRPRAAGASSAEVRQSSPAAPSAEPSASASVTAASPSPRFSRDEALELLYPEGSTMADVGCDRATTDDDAIHCLIDARYAGDEKALATARAFYDEFGSIPGLEREYTMDGGFRGAIQFVPEEPVGRYQKHFDWVLAAQRDMKDVFDAAAAKASHAVRYRYRPIGWKFLRSVGRTTPSAYAVDWRVGYNVLGSLNTSMQAVRDTMVHEIFHDNDGEAGDWSRRTIGDLFDGIFAKCGMRIACLTPYAPMKTLVKNGTYYAFQPGNGDSVHEYAAELASRWFLETRAALRGETFPDKPFKCGPPENGVAWAAIVDAFFGGVDLSPACDPPRRPGPAPGD